MTELVQFEGLPGLSKQVEGPLVKSYSGAARALLEYDACGAASDYCAIQAWKDDEGNYRGGIFVRHHMKKEIVSRSLYKLRNQLRQWWPAMRDPYFLNEVTSE